MKELFSKFKIQSKKDWVIFWVFAALISYGVAYNYDTDVTYRLRSLENPWLWVGNEPQSYGRMIIAVVILAVVAEIVCFLRHKDFKIKLAVLAAGLILPVALTGMYVANCNLIVSVIWQEEPDMTVYWGRHEDTVRYVPNEEEQAALLEYCRNMTIVSDDQVQEELMQWYRDTEGSSLWSPAQIDMHFPKKYGHSCWLKVQVWEDYLYIFRGYGRNSILITLFEDNGLIAYLEELQQKQADTQR